MSQRAGTVALLMGRGVGGGPAAGSPDGHSEGPTDHIDVGRDGLPDRPSLADDRGGVSMIAGMAALTIGVLAAAGIVVGVMMDHARAVPGPNGTTGSGDLVIIGGE